MQRRITLRSISAREYKFLRGLLWAPVGVLGVSAVAFVVLVTARPVSGRVGRRLIAILFVLALVAVEGLLYYFMRHYTHKYVVRQEVPAMYPLFRNVMLGGGLLGLLFTAFLFSK